MSKVKICGITSIEDGMAAVNAGADALGFVFYKASPRNVDVSQASEITRQLPPFVTKVALFVDESPSNIETVLRSCAIDCIQFHGDEDNEFCAQFGKPFLKALRVRSKELLDQQMASFPDASAFLLDAFVQGVPGGTGVSFDWTLYPKNSNIPVIVAGGLTPENVSDCVAQLQPYAVDVSGGVEASKGIKDHDKVRSFIEHAKEN